MQGPAMWKLIALTLMAVAGAAVAQPAPVQREWLELTARGPELRLVTPSPQCPSAELDGRSVPMQRRAAADADFPVTVCRLAVPGGVRRAAIGDWIAPLPKPQPQRILIFGDTGCRLKGAAVQACNDPRRWPLALVAARAAARKPDLVIHVGDYWYRETPCPASDQGCAGSPYGDNWTTWDAEFFAPAAPLLANAPWVMVRGNHESCARGGPGWFRLLDQDAEPLACPAESAPFRVRMGDTSLYVLDSADTNDTSAPAALVSAFARQIDTLGPELDHGRGWIITHRPIWGLTPVARLGPLGALRVELNKTEEAAVRGRPMAGVQMVVSGHIHHFAAYDFGPSRPAQLVAGTGGDVGEPADSPKILEGPVSIDGLDAEGFAFERYGYLLLDRTGADWTGAFRDLDDKVVATCRLHLRRLTCKRAPGHG
ncbi:MAG TPA: metallophosphoesterase [Caulobacteraceae bacterium]